MLDKIIEELEGLKSNKGFGGTLQTIYSDMKLDKAIEIVERYIGDNWTSVVLNPDKFPIIPETKDSVNVIVTTYGALDGRNIEYTEYDETDGFNTINKVLAWRYDDIEPYKGE